MKRWQIAALLVVACSASAAAGYWAGFREAWTLGVAVDLLPRGARSVAHLEAMEAGKPRPGRAGLAVRPGKRLFSGDRMGDHPPRRSWAPRSGRWGFSGHERH